jgi:hypothetical protein
LTAKLHKNYELCIMNYALFCNFAHKTDTDYEEIPHNSDYTDYYSM